MSLDFPVQTSNQPMDFRLSMDENSLAPFRAAWDSAIRNNSRSAAQTAQAANAHHAALDSRNLAPFLRTHLETVPLLARMLNDPQWRIDAAAQAAFVGALSYFVDPVDLIPDGQSNFGLLDDAIVLELALAAHAEEWQAWREFDECREMFESKAMMGRCEWFGHARIEIAALLQHRRHADYSSYAPQAAWTEFRLQ